MKSRCGNAMTEWLPTGGSLTVNGATAALTGAMPPAGRPSPPSSIAATTVSPLRREGVTVFRDDGDSGRLVTMGAPKGQARVRSWTARCWDPEEFLRRRPPLAQLNGPSERALSPAASRGPMDPQKRGNDPRGRHPSPRPVRARSVPSHGSTRRVLASREGDTPAGAPTDRYLLERRAGRCQNRARGLDRPLRPG